MCTPMRNFTAFRKTSRVPAALLAALLAILLAVPAPAQQALIPAQQAPVVPENSPALGELLQKGRQLELQSRWGDALSHYEDAIRAFPGERSLERRYEFARLHYDLGRRYGDKSFLAAADGLSRDEALDLYCDVLGKIQTHYVEAPNWKDLVERGANNLEVALTELPFLSRNLPNTETKTLVEFRQELRRLMGPKVIQGRNAAREAVGEAADLAQKRLGIAVAPVILEYLCGATNSLDPYSAFLTPGQLDEVYSQIEGNFVGLGIELKADQGALLIVRVISHSPAQQAGVRNGDRILAVDGKSTQNLTTDQAADLLQGPVGSVVELSLSAPGESPRIVSIRRQRVEVPSVDEVRIADPRYGVAYLKLTCFQKTTNRDLDAALWDLHRQGMKSLIVDLRGNPGGLLTTAVEVVDKFVDRGVIVSTRGRSLDEDFTYSAHVPGTWRVPLVVLIDKDSASAAEIFAGAIRDLHRGTIVGQRSYGKGSVQGIFPLNYSSAGVRLTTAKFYSPNGHPYNRIGVDPDTVVHLAAKPVDGSHVPPATADDATMAAGLQAARHLVGQR
jgi:carboxyl-terminal processing protease